MKLSAKHDILINVLLPLLAGSFIYIASSEMLVRGIVRNYLPDGLWAYSFVSSILIIWNRQIKWRWLVPAIVVTITFEYLQYINLVNGVFDYWDIFVCCAFCGLALFLNKYFIPTTKKSAL